MLSLLNTPLKLGTKLPSLKGSRKFLYLVPLILVFFGGISYYRLVYVPAHTVLASPMQTASVRQGELTLAATGDGTLTAPEETLGFSDGGEMTVTAVYVKAGDLVSAGDLLAQVNSQQATSQYDQAKQKYDDLTSAVGIAAAERAVADAQANVQSAKLQLEYLISPDVMYWEAQSDEGQTTLDKALTQLSENPDDKAAQKSAKKARAFLSFAQAKLADAWHDYYHEYVPDTFPVDSKTGARLAPTDIEITQARLAIGDAGTKLNEAQEYLGVLNGDPMPENTSNDSLIALQKARSNLQEAKATLDGTKILAPFSGTIMRVNASGGDTAAYNSSDSDVVDAGSVIVIDDTSHPYVEVYWNESDWSLLKVGTAVEITFDDLPDQAFTGKITKVDSDLYTSGSSSAVRGEVSLDTSFADLNLPVGASASVQAVNKRAEDAIYIPVEALHDLGSGQYAVFVMTNGEPKVRMVELGIQTDKYVQVTSGLQAGDVVTTGLVETK